MNATHLAGQLLAEAIGGQQSDGFDLFAKVPHITFPGGKPLRSPLLALGMAWYRLKENSVAEPIRGSVDSEKSGGASLFRGKLLEFARPG